MGEMFVIEDSLTSMIAARVDSNEFKLPVFNRVALEVQNAVSAEADIRKIESIILKDQALASEILRVANSAFFAGLAKQQNIQQALVRLGTDRALSLVMMTARKQAFSAAHPLLCQIMNKLWQHAAASATACRWVAIKCGYPEQAETAFLCGLLHDLGSLVVLKALDEILLTGIGQDLTEPLIHEVFASLHTEYGHRIMQSWHLPPHYAQLALNHHQPARDNSDQLLLIVRVVDAACAKVGIGLSHEPTLVLEALEESRLLGFREVHLAELEIQLEELLEAGI